MLVIALGLVLAAMRQLGRPSTARRLEQLFTSPLPTTAPRTPNSTTNSTTNPITPNFVAPIQEASKGDQGQDRQEPELPNSFSADAEVSGLLHVKDKTYFLPAEREAWFSLFAKLQETDESRLARETCGEVSYAQLLQQPDVYRGRLVTIVGNVVREEIEQPAKNQLGIDSYHRLWIQPRGGGQWPLVVYCLKLPAEFPRGENLTAHVSITGFFFKNWSYAYQGGLGLAPVVLANKLQWQPPVAITHASRITTKNWIMASTLACVFAAITTWLAIRHTRRRSYTPMATQHLQEILNREPKA